jgi:Ca-activated chloride channel homolog
MKNFRKIVRPLLITSIVAGLSACAVHQQQSPTQYEEEGEKIVVTGSRIRREDVTTTQQRREVRSEASQVVVTERVIERTSEVITESKKELIEFRDVLSPEYGYQVFKKYGVNPTIETNRHNQSTFSMDVDNGSYRLAKSMLMQSKMPNPDGIRSEEFINAFHYQYALSDDLIGLSAEVAPSPFRPGYHILHLGVQVKQVKDSERLPSNLVLVVDVSGSMGSDNKIQMLKSAMTNLVAQLTSQDKVSIIAYNNSANIVLEPTSAGEKSKIYRAINSLSSGGGTNAAQGLLAGYRLANEAFQQGHNNRIIMTSDGMANVGDVSPEVILAKIKSYKDKGIFLTTVGVGSAMYNDHLLEQLANQGNGQYVYLANQSDIQDTFVDGINSQLQTMVKDAKIQVTFNKNKVTHFRQIGYENRSLKTEDFLDGSKDGGELGAGHRVTALYEIKLNPNYRKEDIGRFAVSYKKPMGNRVFELNKVLPSTIIREHIATSASDTKLSIVAASFAEKLRQTYWSGFYDYASMQAIIAQMPIQYQNSKQVQVLSQLILKASMLDQRVNPYQDTLSQSLPDFDRVPMIQ